MGLNFHKTVRIAGIPYRLPAQKFGGRPSSLWNRTVTLRLIGAFGQVIDDADSLSTRWFEASDFQSDTASARMNRVMSLSFRKRAFALGGRFRKDRDMRYDRSAHRVHHHRYHIVRATKRRHRVPVGDPRLRVRTICGQTCRGNGVEILHGALSGAPGQHVRAPRTRHLRSCAQDGRPSVPRDTAQVLQNPQAVPGPLPGSRQPPGPSRTDPCSSTRTVTYLTPPAPAGSCSLWNGDDMKRSCKHRMKLHGNMNTALDSSPSRKNPSFPEACAKRTGNCQQDEVPSSIHHGRVKSFRLRSV